jgi:DNA-binding response OmpR family regulator
MCLDVLIIEDSPSQAVLFKALLEREGYAVMVAGEAFEGLEKIKQQQPKLVLLDLELPSLSGFQVLNLIHRQDHALPIIIMSHRAPDGNASMARRLGAVEYLPKDQVRQQLCLLVNQVLGSRGVQASRTVSS